MTTELRNAKKLPLQRSHYEVLRFVPLQQRAEGDVADGQQETESFDIVLSSDTPIDRGWCIETLGHEKKEIDLTFARNGLTMLLEHGGPAAAYSGAIDPNMVAGIFDEFRVEDGKLKCRATPNVSPAGQLLLQDWKSAKPSRRFISVGWKPISYKESGGANGSALERRWTRWQPREGSVVAIPADPTAGVNRSAGAEEFPVENEGETPKKEEKQMETPTVETPTPEARGGSEEKRNDPKARNKEIAEIVRLCDSNGFGQRSAEFIEKGMSMSDVKDALFDEIAKRSAPPRITTAEALDGLSDQDRKKYSFSRALALQLEGRKFDGLEGQMHTHLQKYREAKSTDHGGILVPWDLRSEEEILRAEDERMQRRTMDTQTPGKGAEWVGTKTMQLIELLEAIPVLPRLGANINTGMVDSMSYPRETGAPTVSWKGENPGADSAASDLSTGEITSMPRELIGIVAASRKWLYQTGGRGDARIRRRLAVGHGNAADRAGFTGAGTGSMPLGGYFLAEVQSVAMSSVAPTWALICQMIGKIWAQNAEGFNVGFATTNELAAFLMSKLMDSVAGAGYIWKGPNFKGDIGGYLAIASNQISKTLTTGGGTNEHGFIGGPWETVDVNYWGPLEVVVDEVTGAPRGLVKVNTFSMADVVYTQPQAFCVGLAAKPL